MKGRKASRTMKDRELVELYQSRVLEYLQRDWNRIEEIYRLKVENVMLKAELRALSAPENGRHLQEGK